MPSPNSWKCSEGKEDYMFPVLHDMGSDIDLSIVGRDDCGHMRVDVELCAPLDLFRKARAYILVSLPMIARWHTSERFNAERILRQSGKFDYSEPQFFDAQFPNRHRHYMPGPLNVLETYWRNYTLCEYETRNESRIVSLDSNTQVSLFEPSTLPSHMATVQVSLSSVLMSFSKFYGQLSRVFFTNQNQICRAGMLEKIQKILECGSDLNNFLLSRQVDAHYDSYICGNSIRWNVSRMEHCFDLFGTWRFLLEKTLLYFLFDQQRFIPQFNYNGIRDAHRFISFLLRNGLSFFYISPIRNSENRRSRWKCESESANKSLLRPLFLHHPPMPEAFLPIARGIARQLLALGYGRRELHSAPLPLHDEHLDDACRALESFSETLTNKSHFTDELQSLVQHFREGPLSLQRLTRVAVRRSVGGADFARQVKRLVGLIPLALVQYVADPTELMLSDEEVDQLVQIRVSC